MRSSTLNQVVDLTLARLLSSATLPVDPPIWDASDPAAGSRNYGAYGSGPSMYSSQGRYGGANSFGGGQGRWSSTPASQPVPAGQGGFRSALSTFKGSAAKLGGFSRPSSSAPVRAGFKPPMPVASVPQRSGSLTTNGAARPSLSATAGIPLAPIPRSRPEVDGPPGIVETRGSLVNDAVLVNPKLSAPGPSKSNDLLASFQKGAEDDLDVFKRLVAEPQDTASVGQGPTGAEAFQYAPGQGKAPPMSPKAKGGKKRAAPSDAPGARATRQRAKK